jgi:rod shape-determining protein MreD
MIYLILVISFLLDNLISFFLNTNLLFNPLLSLVSLIIIFRYYHRKDENKYLITSFVLGLVYDIVCTDTVFLNAGIYLLLSLFIIKFYKIFSYNLLNSAILLIIVIIIYRSITFLVLSNFNFISFNLYHLLQSISSSLILNLLYLSFFFLKKKKYKRYLQA